MCQSVADPSSAEYWHMGAMMMRFSSRNAPRSSGVNSGLSVCEMSESGVCVSIQAAFREA